MKNQIQELDIADKHRNMMRSFLITSASLLLFAFSSESATLFVSGDANIFGSGHLSPPAPAGGDGGIMPPGISIPAGDHLILKFSSVTGLVTMTKSFGFNRPDGNLGFLPSNLSSFGGLSGIRHDGNGFLAGVFLGPDEPVDPAPPALDFRTSDLGRSFRTLSPQICQLFFVGDGRTGDGLGDVQQFVVPGGSTRFFLGFVDAANYQGVPGHYQDNAGMLAATFEIEPERKAWGVYAMIAGIIWLGVMLALAGLLLGLLYFRRRSKRQEVEPQPTASCGRSSRLE